MVELNPNEELKKLRDAVREMRAQAIETERALNKVLNDSHLRSTLTLLQQDIGLRNILELTSKSPSRFGPFNV